jgi:heterodisulfide reductase subunit C
VEKLFTWEEVAKSIGVTVEELKAMAFKEGLIDERGLTTQKALDEGLLKLDMEVHIPSTPEEKRKAIIFAELSNYQTNPAIFEPHFLKEIKKLQKMSDKEIDDAYDRYIKKNSN